MSVSGWYADPLNRVKHELVSVGDLCAVMSGNSFQRYLTINCHPMGKGTVCTSCTCSLSYGEGEGGLGHYLSSADHK